MTHKLSPQEVQIYEQLCLVESAKEIAKKLKNNNSYRGTIINIFRKIDNNQKEGLLLHLQVLSETEDREYETYYRQYFMGLIKKLQTISKQEKFKQKISPEDEQKMLLLDIIQKLKQIVNKHRKNEQKVQNLIQKQQQQKKSKSEIPESSIIQNIQIFEDIVSLKSSNVRSQPEEQLQKKKQSQVKKSQFLNYELKKILAIIIFFYSLFLIIIVIIMRLLSIEFSNIFFVVVGCILLMIICIGFSWKFEQIRQFFSKKFKNKKIKQN